MSTIGDEAATESVTEAATEAERPLRRDAARNRALILETAAEVFAEHGLEAGYDEIARRAHIGVGTVYRRFPERDELVRALFESRIDAIVALAREAGERGDAWDGLTWFFTKVVEQQVADRGLKEVLTRTITDEEHSRMGRDRLEPLIDGLVRRARADGMLRADVDGIDIGVPLMLMSSISTPDQPDLWRRYVTLFFDGLRARPEQLPLPLTAPADGTMHEVMRNLHGR